ncbi:MAG: hypothetical protein U1E05_01600 [Patescibacteria group bacterium]|nr:hypothetical protein [Patescibacteria group bacterium]
MTAFEDASVPLPNRWTLRWRMRWLWYRSCYTFLWAHHPLCETFREDVLRIGKVHLCRSCCCVYLGIVLAAVGGVVLFSFFREHSLAILAAVLLPTLLLSFPKLYKRLPRCCRDLCRFGMGAMLPVTFGLLGTGYWPLAFVVAAILWCFWRFYFRIRQERRATICDTCREYGRQNHCSGAIQQATCLSAYQEAATEFLYASLAGLDDSGQLHGIRLQRACDRAQGPSGGGHG